MKKDIRLDKLLGNLGYGSRRDVTNMVRAGRIVHDGVTLARADQRIAPDDARRLIVDGRPVDPLPPLVLMMHKPLGTTCSHDEAGPLVYDLLPDRWRRRDPPLSSVGRLDKNTSGLLILTDDGSLLHRIIAPKSNVPKRYRARLARPVSPNAALLFAEGTLMLEGELTPLRAAALEVLAPTDVRITITEGRYHQVRRMFAAIGNHVKALHREAVGGLKLPDAVASGDYVMLRDEDVATIFDDQAEGALATASRK